MTESERLFTEAYDCVRAAHSVVGDYGSASDTRSMVCAVEAIVCAIGGLAETIRETSADPYLMTGFKVGGTD